MSFILHELHSITKLKKPVDLNYVKILEGFFVVDIWGFD